MHREGKRHILADAAARGSLWTRLSFLVMGAGCIRYKQFVRGAAYLLSEVGFIFFFRDFALQYLSRFATLGTETQRKVWNEELQIFQRVPGDNSMLILLFSVLSIAVCAVFLYLWYANVRDAWRAQENTEHGCAIASFRDDLRAIRHEQFHVTLLALPMLTMVLFTVLPIVFMILIAFTNFDADHQPPGNLFTWVGMSNVTDIFLGNAVKTRTFFGLLGWTIVWAILATFTNYFFGMLLAVAINSKLVRLKKVWRTCFVIAIAIPQFVSLLLISRALEPAGAINVLLMKLGVIESPLPFLLDPTLARIVAVTVNMWIGIPYSMITFSGVLMNIPAELYESAEIDGAGPMRKFISITLPYMFFVTAPATITTFVTNFNNFNVIYLLTAGGPFSLDYYQAGKTDLLVTWLYKLTVNRNDYSLASTIGIFIFLLVGSCSLIVYNRTGAVTKEDQFQ